MGRIGLLLLIGLIVLALPAAAQLSDPFTVWGYVKNETGGNASAGLSVTLSLTNVSTPCLLNNQTTASGGSYSYDLSWCGSGYYRNDAVELNITNATQGSFGYTWVMIPPSGPNVQAPNMTLKREPQWRDLGQNKTSVPQGDSILLYARGVDGGNLTNAWLATNETGVWQNWSMGKYGSPINFSAPNNSRWLWSNFSWQNGSITPGTNVGWRIYYQDNEGRTNNTGVMVFNVTAGGPVTRVVNQSYACTAGYAYYYNIQSAIDAANPGDEIVVCGGTYTESITVNKSITLRAYNTTYDAIVNSTSSSQDAIAVSANYVNISWLKVQNATGADRAGINVSTAGYANISHVWATSNYDGIRFHSFSNNNTLTNNNINDNSDGIVFFSYSSNNTLTNNNVVHHTNSGIYFYITSSNNTLTNNTASGNTWGIFLGSSYNNITNNNVSGNAIGIYLYPSTDPASSYNNIVNNTANNNTNSGIYLGSNNNYNNIINNTANSNANRGIYLNNSSNNTLTGNNIFSNTKNGVTITGNSLNNPLNYNNIYNNPWNLNLTQSQPVNATYNYWGTIDCMQINNSIYDYQDNVAYGNVSYQPFLNAAYPGGTPMYCGAAPAQPPPVMWTWTYNPSGSVDDANSIATSSSNSIYVGGFDNIPGNGQWRVAKFWPNGTQAWNWTQNPSNFGGYQDDEIISIAADSSDNIYATGYDKVPSNAQWRVVKLYPNGTQAWNWTDNPTGLDDAPYAIAVDLSNNIYVGGHDKFFSNDQWRVVKLYPNGTQAWNWTDNPSGGSDLIESIAVDQEGNLYPTGHDKIFGNDQWRVVKLYPNGTQAWNWTDNPSGNDDQANSVAVDSQGNVYAAGMDGLYGSSNTQWRVVKLYPNGTQAWNWTDNPSSGNDMVESGSISVDSSGNVYAAGTDYFYGNYQWRVVKLYPNGTQAWNWTDNPSGGSDAALAIATDSSGNIYTAGTDSVLTDEQWRVVRLGNTPVVFSPLNNKTNNASTNFSLNVGENVRFDISGDQFGTFTWKMDGAFAKGENGTLNNFTTSFPTAGTHNVSVNLSGTNGTSSTLMWNITVQLGGPVTRVVNQSSPACTAGYAYYSNLQSAITAANPGDTIKVCAGTYSESLIVNKSIILTGNNATYDAIVDTAPSTNAITVTSSNVNISWLKVQGASNYPYAGIRVNANSVNLSNNWVTSNWDGITLGASSNNILANNNASGNAETGIYLNSASNNNTLANNNASGNNYYGIHLQDSSNNTLTNNNASNNLGIGIVLAFSSNNNLTNNTASNNPWVGIYLQGSNSNTLMGNNASSNYGGILFSSSSNNTLTGNNIFNNTNNGTAIRSGSTNNLLNYNNIYNNPWNLNLTQSQSVNATYNYWGTTDCVAISASIYDYQDNSSNGNVSFQPFLNADYPGGMPMYCPAPPTPTGNLSSVLNYPVVMTNVIQNGLFYVNATVTCTGVSGATCGLVNGSVRYNASGMEPDTIVGTDMFNASAVPFVVKNNTVLNLTASLPPGFASVSYPVTNLAFDSLNGLVYIGGSKGGYTHGILGVYNRTTNTTTNLTSTLPPEFATGGWPPPTTNLVFDSLNGLVYIGGSKGISEGILGVYNRTTNTTTNLTSTLPPEFATGSNTVTNLVFDSLNGLVYIGGQKGNSQGILGVYNRTTNTTTNLTSTLPPEFATGNRAGTNLAFDSLNGLVYIGGRKGIDTVEGILGVYNRTTNTTINLTSTLPPEFATGGSYSGTNLTFDSINGLVYIGGSKGPDGKEQGIFGVYNRSANTTINLTSTLPPDFATGGSDSVTNLVFDPLNGLVYIGGSKYSHGIFGVYNSTTNTTTSLTPTLPPEFAIGGVYSSGTNLAFDSINGLVYIGGSQGNPYYGIFGVYPGGNPRSCGAMKQGESCTFNFTVNATGAPASWLVDVDFRSNNANVSANNTSNAQVNIGGADTTPPLVTINLPFNGGYNAPLTVNATVTDAESSIMGVTYRWENATWNGTWLQMSFAGGNSWDSTAYPNGNVSDGNYTIRINATNSAGLFNSSVNTSGYGIGIDRAPPVINNTTAVVSSAQVLQGGLVNLSVNITDNLNANSATFTVRYPNGTTQNYSAFRASGSATSGTWNFTFDTFDKPTGTYNWTFVNASDAANNTNNSIIEKKFDVVITKNISVVLGRNLIALPVDIGKPYYVEPFCTDISVLNMVSQVLRPQQNWQSHICGIQANNYSMELGDGYWASATASANISLTGFDIAPVTQSLSAGWNLIGVRNVTQAEPICNSINTTCAGGCTNSVVMLNTTTDQYSSHVCGFGANNFTMSTGVGYWVNVNQSTTWTY
jgi:parallel beta-helix repeat protein